MHSLYVFVASGLWFLPSHDVFVASMVCTAELGRWASLPRPDTAQPIGPTRLDAFISKMTDFGRSDIAFCRVKIFDISEGSTMWAAVCVMSTRTRPHGHPKVDEHIRIHLGVHYLTTLQRYPSSSP